MQAVSRAKKIVESAESQIQALLVEAAEEGDYDAIGSLTQWGKALRALTKSAPPDPQDNRVAGDRNAHRPEAIEDGKVQRLEVARERSRGKLYPYFIRDRDFLVKAAWSKAVRGEYEHKTPMEIVLRVVEKINAVGKPDSLFLMENVLPITDANGSEVPTYQAYSTLAWLRATGLILRHGRQGYSIKTGCDLPSEAEAEWDKLKQRAF